MLYVITYKFKDNIDKARAEARETHIDHVNGAEGRLKVAGPLLNEDDPDKVAGSLIIIEAESQTAAALFANTDPYVKADIVESITIKPWRAVLGGWKDQL